MEMKLSTRDKRSWKQLPKMIPKDENKKLLKKTGFKIISAAANTNIMRLLEIHQIGNSMQKPRLATH